MIHLHNLHIIQKGLLDISIDEDKIASIGNINAVNNNDIHIKFENAICFPGLINSHDHLHFNSFPKIGNSIYADYMEWEQDVQQNNKQQINAVLQIPEKLRIEWSLYKNLLNGITTVVHHDKPVDTNNSLINIVQESNVLHSIAYEKNWKLKLNNPFNQKPYSIHIGEGTSNDAHKEIDTLLKWNILNKELIAIHGVAMDALQAKHFKALVWCPDSNYFLLDATANINELKQHCKILFGTDSTLSADWSLLKHLQLANKLGLLTKEELYQSLTSSAAKVWNLEKTGSIEEGFYADIVIANKKEDDAYAAFFALMPADILLVMHKGNIRLFDESMLSELTNIDLKQFSKIEINGAIKFVQGNLPQLLTTIRKHYPAVELPIKLVQ